MTARPKTSRAKRIRIELLERDGTCCKLCGHEMPEGDRTIDHIIPRSEEGNNDISNLQLAHAACNSHRMSMSIEEWKVYYAEHLEIDYFLELYKPTHTFKVNLFDQKDR